ncbi:autotransporter outer membrane beta-barrel domain-containing protein [Candidatus Accumulibacter phosphatis]|uniref:Autotransporter outer membrane beta-barrel domain-containing protein n=1 Tax=Candidatus Accumulibacter phosphatis TaxID=327160 RepID=A0ABX1TR84_9PROT|nr:autotransporter outer membrane beta-barrel domain-containing protein [Candidatus Accumulibacter phosphatis]
MAISYDGDLALAGSLTNQGLIQASGTRMGEGSYEYFGASGVVVTAELLGTLTNSGAIRTSVDSDGYSEAFGLRENIYGLPAMSGTLINSGILEAAATGSAAEASGIALGLDLSGMLTNSGTISARATSVSGDARAFGVRIFGNLLATLTNSGTINATATAAAAEVSGADVGGIYVDGALRGTLTNSGAINAVARASAGEYSGAEASGVHVDDVLSGTLANSGMITSSATSTAYAYAAAVSVKGDLSGTLTNSGAIDATARTADAKYSSYARAEGVLADGDYGETATMSGTLINAGTINATATDAHFSKANGVYLGGDLNGRLINEGVIKATATTTTTGSGWPEAFARGVFVESDNGEVAGMSGLLTNSGTIAAAATATGSAESYARAYAAGVSVDKEYRGFSFGPTATVTLTNSGTISATATSTAYSEAVGVLVRNLPSATLFNSGAIKAAATATYYPEASGVSVEAIQHGGTLTNSGTIDATATGGGGAYKSAVMAYGARIWRLNGTLINSGTISATATATDDAYPGDATAHGVDIRQFDDGALANSGLIAAAANATGDSRAVAIAVSRGAGRIDNLAGGHVRGHLQIDEAVALNNAGHILIPALDFGRAAGEGERFAGSYVRNNYTQQTGGVLELGVHSVSRYAALEVGGVADFTESNALAVNLDPAHAISPGDALAHVVTAGTLSSPRAFEVTDNSALLDFTAEIVDSGADEAASRRSEAVAGNAINLIAVNNTDYCGRSVSTARTGPCEVAFDSPTLTVTPTGSITGASSGINVLTGTSTSITNSGTVSGSDYGIYFMRDAVLSGSIVNSGTISGGRYAIFADRTISNDSSLTSIDVVGSNARVIGDVHAPMAAFNVTRGALFSSEGQFNVDTFNIANTGTFNMAHGVRVQNASASAFNNAGRLAVAAEKTATITGNYTQTPAGTFQTGVAGNAQYGKLEVSGTATLPAAARIAVDVVGSPALTNGTVLPAVIKAGTLNASTFAVTDNSALFDFRAAQNGNSVDLAIAASSQTGIFDAVSGNSNPAAGAAARVLDSLTVQDPSHPISSLFQALTLQAAVSDAVADVLPLMFGGMPTAVVGILNASDRIIQARHEAARGLSSGDDFLTNRQFWIKPIGSWARQGDVDDVPGYKANSYGLLLGADGDVADHVNLGVAFAYASSDVSLSSSATDQDAKVNGYRLIGYGQYKVDDRTRVGLQADFGVGDTKGRRHINFAAVNSTASSHYDNWNAHVGVGLSRDYPLSSATTVTPSARADYVYFRDDGYSESGAGPLDLIVKPQTLEQFVLFANAKLTHALDEKTSLLANLGAGYDTMARQASIVSAFAGGGAQFTTRGLDLAPWIARGGVGLVVSNSKAIELALRYDFEARESYINNTASVRFQMPF